MVWERPEGKWASEWPGPAGEGGRHGGGGRANIANNNHNDEIITNIS